MPSNKDLTDAILKLDPKAEVDGLNNLRLENLLAGLESTAPAAPSDPVVSVSSEPARDFEAEAAKTASDAEAKRSAKLKADSEAEAKKQAEANAAAEAAVKGNSTHRVADGKAITCLRGVVSSEDAQDMGGGRVSARDFGQKEVDLDRLVAAGVLVKL
jgi:hypothetical protein